MAVTHSNMTHYCFIIFPIVILYWFPKEIATDILGQIQNIYKIAYCFYNES